MASRYSVIQTPNYAILVSTENPRSLESTHANEGAIEGLHTGKMITCLLRLHDDFADFFFNFTCFLSMVGIITKLRK